MASEDLATRFPTPQQSASELVQRTQGLALLNDRRRGATRQAQYPAFHLHTTGTGTGAPPRVEAGEPAP